MMLFLPFQQFSKLGSTEVALTPMRLHGLAWLFISLLFDSNLLTHHIGSNCFNVNLIAIWAIQMLLGYSITPNFRRAIWIQISRKLRAREFPTTVKPRTFGLVKFKCYTACTVPSLTWGHGSPIQRLYKQVIKIHGYLGINQSINQCTTGNEFKIMSDWSETPKQKHQKIHISSPVMKQNKKERWTKTIKWWESINF